MPCIEPDRLESWLCELVTAHGAPEEIARTVSRSLVNADLRGHSSHGVRLWPAYVERIASTPDDDVTRIDPPARPAIEARDGPRFLVDGQSAFGRVVGRDATDIAIQAAKEHGLATVGVRNGNHLGRVGEWAEMAADAGLLFLAFVKAEANLVAPPGSATRRLSTNPIVAGVPTFDALEFPIVLDMATSVAAGGKVLERARMGQALPDGWVVDDAGEPMAEGGRFVDSEGALLPLGGTTAGHKGFGLAVVAELFGALFGNGVVAGEREHVPYNNTVAILAVDPTWYTPKREIAGRIRTFVEHVRQAEVIMGSSADAGDGVLLPGEREHRTELANRQSGLELSEETLDDLQRCALQVGVDPLKRT